MIWLLVILLPPVAVLMVGKPMTALLNLLLTLFFWIPGVIHAFLVVKEKKDDKRMDKYVKAMSKTNNDGGVENYELLIQKMNLDKKDNEEHMAVQKMGAEFEEQGKTDAAKDCYWKLVNSDTDLPDPYNRLAIMYRKEQLYKKEVEVLKKAVYTYEEVVNKKRPDREKKLEQFKDRLAKAEELYAASK